MAKSSNITSITQKTAAKLKSTPLIQLPEINLNLSQTVSDKKTNTSELIPIGETTFLQVFIPFGGSFGYLESKDEQW